MTPSKSIFGIAKSVGGIVSIRAALSHLAFVPLLTTCVARSAQRSHSCSATGVADASRAAMAGFHIGEYIQRRASGSPTFLDSAIAPDRIRCQAVRVDTAAVPHLQHIRTRHYGHRGALRRESKATRDPPFPRP